MIGTANVDLSSTGAAPQQYATGGDVSATVQAYMAKGSFGTAVIRIEGSNDRSIWTPTGVTLSAVGTSSEAAIAAYAYVRLYVVTAQAGAIATCTVRTFTTTGYATIPLDLADLSAAGASNGDVVTLTAGVWTAEPPSGGPSSVISGSVNVAMTGNSGTATYALSGVTGTSILTAAIVGVAKTGDTAEDHIAEELKVYTTNQATNTVDVVILSPHGFSTNTYQVNIIGV